MKSKLLKILMTLLGFGGFTSCIMTVEYGSPHADYVFNVEVLDEESSAPIPAIKVSIEPYHGYEEPNYSTDKNGMVQIKVPNIEHFGRHTLVFEDVDGPQNGGDYQRYSIGITTHKDNFKGGDGDWYLGTATHNITAYLQHTTTDTPDEEENN